jgi:hypothetical protein
MNPADELVPAHQAASSSEAELVRALLEEAGLFAVVPDRNTALPGVDLTPFGGQYNAMGCQVLVRAGDLERAQEVLAEARTAPVQTPDEEDPDEPGD